jgi:hypothetical protein
MQRKVVRIGDSLGLPDHLVTPLLDSGPIHLVHFGDELVERIAAAVIPSLTGTGNVIGPSLGRFS